MILQVLFDLIKSFILLIVGLFPALPDLSFLSQSLQSVVSVFSTINSFISVSLVAWCFLTIIVFMNINFLWSIVMWVVRKIPGVS